MDIGPFEVEGFVPGPQTFAYNPGQQGEYTTADPGDGSVPIELLAFDTTYTFSGPGDPTQGIGAFSGELHMPAPPALTSPPLVDLPIGFPGIEVDGTAELLLEWDGAVAGSNLTITLSGNPQGTGTAMKCRVEDDGEFLVPAEVVTAAGFGGLAMLNMVMFERSNTGEASGEGLTFTDVAAMQSMMVNVRRLP